MSLLHLDAAELRANYDRRPFQFTHSLQGHPLLRVGALFDLARRLPPAQVLHWNGRIPVTADFDNADKESPPGCSLEEAIANIETSGSFILLRDAQTDPVYQKLLGEILDEVAVHIEPIDPGMHDRIAYLFIASPGSVTPYHMDREINFLLQIEGEKDYWVWDATDRSVLPEEGLERLFARQRLRRPEYREEYRPRAHRYALRAGTGVHQPFAAPHMAVNGNAVSVAFAATYRTAATHRRAAVHRFNHGLRRLGVQPAPWGKSAFKDSLKYGAVEGFRRARAALRRVG